ncbi:testis-expressed protein 50-like [Ornithorhynchus anatinus]|uniref:Testis expressed 50 n=1 Tax=Ornithorhynchus anatinus TaxID=9258 RepID=A0A6I8N551_ORNAN|nr:testis-expressed protein 50-like [Ornithorhynchus anatinus]
MLPQDLFLAILISSAVSVEEGHCFSDRELWARVGWEILPEEISKLKLPRQPSSYSLPYSLETFCCSFFTFNLFENLLQFLSALLTCLGFIPLALSAYNLWTKWKRPVKKLERNPSSAFVCKKSEGQSIRNTEQILASLVVTTRKLKNFLKQANLQRRMKIYKHSHDGKKPKADANQWAFPIFPICPHTPPPSLDTLPNDKPF